MKSFLNVNKIKFNTSIFSYAQTNRYKLASNCKYYSSLTIKNEKDNISKTNVQNELKNDKLSNFYIEKQDSFEHAFNKLMKEKFFFVNSSSIYGGLKGIFDYGPCGCNIKNNILNLWRSYFIFDEGFSEIETSILTSKNVLKASGHLSNFNDYIVKDMKSGNLYRCDHLIKEYFENVLMKNSLIENEKQNIENILIRLKEMDVKELKNVIEQYKITGPDSGKLSDPGKFNLIFSIGNDSDNSDQIYLRPETAQGTFTNFVSLAKLNHNKLPFGVGQIGSAFRNEIHPQYKLIRTREFQLAEIEYFYNPKFTGHDRFDEVADLEINIWTANDQIDGVACSKMKLKNIVDQKTILENHAYFLGRIHQFLLDVGLDSERLRFRQHLPNECAHYSDYCWDAECLTSVGWVECVGCANRGSYDLMKHSSESDSSLHINKYLEVPRTEPHIICKPIMDSLIKEHKHKTKLIVNHLKSMSQTQIADLEYLINYTGEANIFIDDRMYFITKEMVQFETGLKKVEVESLTPHVIEPSFGIGRILQCVLEHNFYYRSEDPQRMVLTLPIKVAPYKVSILPLSGKQAFEHAIKEITRILKHSNISFVMDNSKDNIGKRYAISDQIGTPFAITIDTDSINKQLNLVTIRERNSMTQVQVQISQLGQIMNDLLSNELLWDDAIKQYGININC